MRKTNLTSLIKWLVDNAMLPTVKIQDAEFYFFLTNTSFRWKIYEAWFLCEFGVLRFIQVYGRLEQNQQKQNNMKLCKRMF